MNDEGPHREKPFRVGQQVRRKEGGPVMRVTRLPDHIVYCEWQDGNARRHGAYGWDEIEPVKQS